MKSQVLNLYLPTQNQPNKKRKLQNSEGFGIFTSNNSYQSPYIDNTETEIHSIGLCPQNDYNIRIFSNHDVSVPLKKTVPQSSPKNIKLKFEDFLDVNKEPVRPHADENLISLVREVMRTTNRNQKIVAMEIGVSQTTMSRYMQSERKSKGWNRIERKLKLWITNLEVKMPTPRKLVVPERNHSADAESKKGAYEHGRPINMRDSCDCFECAIEKQKSNSFTSQYSNPSIEQQLPAAYQTKRLQYSQKSYVDVQPHSSEYGLYDQSTVLFPHPFASPSNRDIADQPQSSFWPPLNLILSFDHTLLLDPNL
jgi:hypothetical protein